MEFICEDPQEKHLSRAKHWWGVIKCQLDELPPSPDTNEDSPHLLMWDTGNFWFAGLVTIKRMYSSPPTFRVKGFGEISQIPRQECALHGHPLSLDEIKNRQSRHHAQVAVLRDHNTVP